MKSEITICWFGIYNSDYSRNYVFLDGFKDLGIKVIECRVDPGEQFAKIKLIRKFLKLRQKCDVVYVAFPAQSVVPIAKLLSRKPVVMDAFYSMYEGIVQDRKLMTRWHPFVWYMAFLDWLSTRLADHIVVDTEQHKLYWRSWGIPPKKISVVPVGTSGRKFFPIKNTESNSDRFIVHFHGTYIPLQGVDVILETAALFKDNSRVIFRLIGDGQTYDSIRSTYEASGLGNVEFLPRVTLTELNEYLNQADVVLGIFGNTKKTQRVVPNKVYEGLAVGKPVITLNTTATSALFQDGSVILTSREPVQIANEIRSLLSDSELVKSVSRRALEKFQSDFSATQLSKLLLNVCIEMQQK